MNDEKRKLLLKRIVKLVCIVLGAAFVLYLVLSGVSKLFRRKTPTRVVDESIRFSSADYDADIFEDPFYVAKERNITWSEYGDSELLGLNCPEDRRWHGMADREYYLSVGEEQAFFRDFIVCLIKGDCTSYPSFFTRSFFDNFTIPDIFTPQKIYDISVEVVNRKMRDDGVRESQFILRYKIMNNNGTYRGDVASDCVRPLVVTVCADASGVLIDSIVFLEGKKTSSN
ncbi:MAG: hypothetical protein J5547_02965 [Clostridia bacterium]|nr:hypothetical protein [Clostridia bacterium]